MRNWRNTKKSSPRKPEKNRGIVGLGFGFTKSELSVLMFLSASLLVGTGVRTIRQQSIPLPASEDEKTSLAIPSFEAAESPEGVESRNDAKPLRVDINRCSVEELERLPGIGPVAAGRIVTFREKNGFFRTVEELDRVHGIGKKTVEKIKPYIVVDR